MKVIRILLLLIVFSFFTYSLVFAQTSPVLNLIGPQSTDEGVNLNFGVSGTDVDGDSLILSTSTLPAGAAFTDNFNGTGTFDWTPDFTQ